VTPAEKVQYLDELSRSLPKLPRSVRYYDDLLDEYRTISNLIEDDSWTIFDDGRTNNLNFLRFPEQIRLILKHVIVILLESMDPTSVIQFYIRLANHKDASHFVEYFTISEPHEVRTEWATNVLPIAKPTFATALRMLLHALCALGIGKWNKHLSAYVSQLPGPKVDTYKTVRTGECFVPLDQQALVVDYFDELVAGDLTEVSDADLRGACILLIVFQYAFRPGQVARIKISDVRIFDTGAVHLSVVLTKKRNRDQRRPVNRSVKREWCPLFIEYRRRRDLANEVKRGVARDSLFGLMPDEVTSAVYFAMAGITGAEWTPMDLRHTAAQRQADAGASHLAIAEFLGHSAIATANVYFDASPTQAQRINNALGLSPIYAGVAQAHRTKTIAPQALRAMPEDKQVGGVPHGIPIAGIGACDIGQSGCIKNPVLSCYTCRKFLPVSNVAIHREVTEGLRPVVHQFAAASRGDESSPAYVQLRRTLEAAERVIEDIEANRTSDA